MIEVNPKSWKYPPLSYQLQGVKDLVRNPLFALFWEMRLRKSKVILDTAGCLYGAGQLEVVIIACPAQVKDVWLQPQFGEIVKHSFVPTKAIEFDKKITLGGVRRHVSKNLLFIVTSFEYLRQEDENDKYMKVVELLEAVKDLSFWLVIDEAAGISNPASATSRAINKLRAKASRVTELDGTPDDGSPEPLYNKFRTLDPMILGMRNPKEFRFKYGVIKRVREGRLWVNKVVGWQRLDDLARLTAPYCSVIKQDDVKGILDLPKWEPGLLPVRLTQKSWDVYRNMRDKMIVELDQEQSWTKHATVKIMRLAQICAGFLGGFQEGIEKVEREVGDETCHDFLLWLMARLEENPNFKCVAWCRWRPEIARLAAKLPLLFTQYGLKVGRQWGDVKDENFLHPDHPYQGAGVMVCQPQAVQYGVSFAKAPAQVFLSRDYNLVTQKQAEQRVQDEVKKIGREYTLLVETLVSGPQGQKTIVHDILWSLEKKIDVSKRLRTEWKKVLEAE